MTFATVAADELRLYCDHAGQVWYGAGRDIPHASGLPLDEFIQHPTFLQANFIRLLGLPQNASILCRLYVMQQEGLSARVQVGSPAVCTTRETRANPELALMKMFQLERPASLGGWHDLAVEDYFTYRLVDQYFQNAPLEELRASLSRHPAKPALTMLRRVDVHSVVGLLSELVDPRWYANFERPDRKDARLRSYLGLWPRSFHLLTSGCRETENPYLRRAMLALRSWTGPIPSTLEDIEHRRWNFLWRFCHYRIEGGASLSLALLRTTQLFTAFLRIVWLDALSSQEVFVPEYFFKNEEDAMAYRQAQREISSEKPKGFDIAGL